MPSTVVQYRELTNDLEELKNHGPEPSGVDPQVTAALKEAVGEQEKVSMHATICI